MTCASCGEERPTRYTIQIPNKDDLGLCQVSCLENWVEQEKLRVSPTVTFDYATVVKGMLTVPAQIVEPQIALVVGDQVRLVSKTGLELWGTVEQVIGIGQRTLYKVKI